MKLCTQSFSHRRKLIYFSGLTLELNYFQFLDKLGWDRFRTVGRNEKCVAVISLVRDMLEIGCKLGFCFRGIGHREAFQALVTMAVASCDPKPR